MLVRRCSFIYNLCSRVVIRLSRHRFNNYPLLLIYDQYIYKLNIEPLYAFTRYMWGVRARALHVSQYLFRKK